MWNQAVKVICERGMLKTIFSSLLSTQWGPGMTALTYTEAYCIFFLPPPFFHIINWIMNSFVCVHGFSLSHLTWNSYYFAVDEPTSFKHSHPSDETTRIEVDLWKVTNKDDKNAGTKDGVACCWGSLLEKLLFLLTLISSWINKEAIFTNGMK